MYHFMCRFSSLTISILFYFHAEILYGYVPWSVCVCGGGGGGLNISFCIDSRSITVCVCLDG